MRQLNGVYTQARNKRYNKTGHLFQGRYKSILIQKESHLLEVCRYVVLNPVRAKIIENPGEWRWSSYRATAGEEAPHPCLTKDWILGQLGRTKTKAEKEYRRFVAAGMDKETIWNEAKGQAILGKEEFVDRLADHLKRHTHIPEIPKVQRYANRPSLEKLFSQGVLGNKRQRNKKITEAVEKHGYTQRAIADHLGVHFTYISRIMRERVER